MFDGKLQWKLVSIGLIEASSQFSNDDLLPSHISGSKQINTIWITPNHLPQIVSILPHSFSVGDHHYFIVDFSRDLFFGDDYIPIARSNMRCLVLSQASKVNRYIQKVELLIHYYKINNKLQALKMNWNNIHSWVWKKRLDLIDKQTTELLLCAKWQYRNLRAGTIAFSPDLSKVGLQ